MKTTMLRSAAICCAMIELCLSIYAQGPNDFPELSFTHIPGAPVLGAPKLIMGDKKPAMGEGNGWASPAFYDIDGDGKKDLLIGEFASQAEHKISTIVGHFIRIYKNLGTAMEPRFTDTYRYLYPAGTMYKGAPLSIETWCCLGFSPHFVDLDNDGYDDILSGQYDPGLITWFRGTPDGFKHGKYVPQVGDHMLGRRYSRQDVPWTNPDSWYYWQYSSSEFSDLDGDGLVDMVTGGSTLRFSKNIGKRHEPTFGLRELLLDTTGRPLTLPSYSGKPLADRAGRPDCGEAMIPCVVDWDGDGVLDLLVSDIYVRAGEVPITFFRGVKRGKDLRFEPGVPLFTAVGGGKAFPGAWLHVRVADWNSDGVNDLIIGASVPTQYGVFDHNLSWQWEMDTWTFKTNPAYMSDEYKLQVEQEYDAATLKLDSLQQSKRLSKKNMEAIRNATVAVTRAANRERLKEAKDQLTFLQKEIGLTESDVNEISKYIRQQDAKPKYETLAHKGYVYVMLGKKNDHE